MRLVAFLFVAVVMGIGLLRLALATRRLEGERQFLATYISKFRRFSENYLEAFDAKEYHWLTHRVMKVQALAGDREYWDEYGAAYSPEAAKKSESLVGILDQMGQQPVPVKTLTSTSSFLVRSLGVLDDFIDRFRKRKRRPLTLFREGIQTIVLSPVLFLQWARGGESEIAIGQLAQRRKLRQWVAFFSLVGLLFPLIVIIVGWGPVVSVAGQLADAVSNGYYYLKDLVETALESIPPPSAPPETPPAS